MEIQNTQNPKMSIGEGEDGRKGVEKKEGGELEENILTATQKKMS